jgi:hypothetical protein
MGLQNKIFTVLLLFCHNRCELRRQIMTVDVTKVDTRTALAAVTPRAGGDSVYLAEANRAGMFVWDPGNRSSQVAADPQEGVYVAPSSDASGASGAWVRREADPLNVRWFGAKGDGIADDTAAIQAAVNYIGNLPNGGGLYIPTGRYVTSAAITLCKYITVTGDGMIASQILATHTGNGFFKTEAVNSSIQVFVSLEKIGIVSINGSSTGAGFYDQGGTEIVIRQCAIQGFKYGIILDQSELVDIELCNISDQLHSCIWLVNGPDLNPNSNGTYTNRISVRGCHINRAAQYGILDDGGVTHAFHDNNYNGCATHIRAAGVTGLLISGGEFEGATGSNIYLTHNTLSNRGAGQCGAVIVQGAMFAPTMGQSAINLASIAFLTVISNVFANNQSTTVALISGMFNCAAFFSAGNAFFADSGPFLDRYAPGAHFSTEFFRLGNAAYNPPSIAAGGAVSTTVSVPGALIGDFAEISFSGAFNGAVLFEPIVTAANTVTVTFFNPTGAAVDPGSGILSARTQSLAR